MNAGHDHPIIFRKSEADRTDENSDQIEQFELSEGGLLGALPTSTPYTSSYFTFK